MKRVAALLAALLTLAILTACGGGDTGTEGNDLEGSESSESSEGKYEREYRVPEDIIAKLQAGGIDCEPDEEGATSTAYSLRGISCTSTTDPDVYYTADVYGSEAQMEEAKVLLVEMQPGIEFLFGRGWSVSIPFETGPEEVKKIMGSGELVGG